MREEGSKKNNLYQFPTNKLKPTDFVLTMKIKEKKENHIELAYNIMHGEEREGCFPINFYRLTEDNVGDYALIIRDPDAENDPYVANRTQFQAFAAQFSNVDIQMLTLTNLMKDGNIFGCERGEYKEKREEYLFKLLDIYVRIGKTIKCDKIWYLNPNLKEISQGFNISDVVEKPTLLPERAYKSLGEDFIKH